METKEKMLLAAFSLAGALGATQLPGLAPEVEAAWCYQNLSPCLSCACCLQSEGAGGAPHCIDNPACNLIGSTCY
jgi:hypothetical protein